MYAAPPNHPDNSQEEGTYQSPAKRSSSITSANSPDEGSEITHCKRFNAIGDSPRRSSSWRTSDNIAAVGPSSESTVTITYLATTRPKPDSAHIAACGVRHKSIHSASSAVDGSLCKGHDGKSPS